MVEYTDKKNFKKGKDSYFNWGGELTKCGFGLWRHCDTLVTHALT